MIWNPTLHVYFFIVQLNPVILTHSTTWVRKFIIKNICYFLFLSSNFSNLVFGPRKDAVTLDLQSSDEFCYFIVDFLKSNRVKDIPFLFFGHSFNSPAFFYQSFF